jgi:hypothetical protein
MLEEFWGYQQQGERPQLLPGKLPDRLPAELPMPQGSRLVGSVVWTDFTNVIFDCDLSRKAVEAYYEEQLTPRGWTKAGSPISTSGSGFAYSSPHDFGVNFCSGEEGPWLFLRSFAAPGRPTCVHAMLHTDVEDSPCSPKQRHQMEHMRGLRMRDVLPELQAPEGATQLGSGGGGGEDSASSSAWLKTDLDLAATLAHYDRQLAAVEWAQVAAGQSAPVGWSTWDLTYGGQKWHGLLTVIAHPWSPGEYRLNLYAEAEDFGRRGRIRFRQF